MTLQWSFSKKMLRNHRFNLLSNYAGHGINFKTSLMSDRGKNYRNMNSGGVSVLILNCSIFLAGSGCPGVGDQQTKHRTGGAEVNTWGHETSHGSSVNRKIKPKIPSNWQKSFILQTALKISLPRLICVDFIYSYEYCISGKVTSSIISAAAPVAYWRLNWPPADALFI